MLSIHDLRQHYGQGELLEKDLPDLPLSLFDAWFRLALESTVKEPNAMVLGTIGPDGTPRSRTVLLKGYSQNGFTFFTNYQSDKGTEIDKNPRVCLNFTWLELEKQIRIEGIATRIPEKESDDYFLTRPIGSQIGAIISHQSQPILNREILETKLSSFSESTVVERPKHWGGYLITPHFMEFWQGRANRLHDRIAYTLQNEAWTYQRLQP